MNTRKICLCRPCMEAEKAKGVKLKAVERGIDKKVLCAVCRRRRFGAVYETGERG